MKDPNDKIAVIGMACKFPGADNPEEFWNNLVKGQETLSHFSDEEIRKVEPYFEELKDNPDYVRVRGAIRDVDKFDAAFFGITPKEATETDPQQRVWLETAWNALEHAGCDPFTYSGAIGVFAGGGISSYLINNILRDPKRMDNYFRPDFGSSTQMILGNDTSYIATKTAYHFNLKGPAVYVQTACSTSLVAIALACQSLYSLESDICLAGGIRISVPQERGYLYQEGTIVSPDGHCRPFDEQAQGMVGSNGAGIVVLKRFEDAVRDNDTIYALVSGWAVNNDGSNKVSFTAPSVDGQAEVIMMAQSMAEVSPEEIAYVETHGTATKIGDPIEVAGLTKAFTSKTNKRQFCGLGSVKSNIGHADAAAGVASFIKTCLSAYHKTIPPSLHFQRANPHIDFANSPFYVLNVLKNWIGEKPLIMGVSSFGIGGTNAHVIVEQYQPQEVRMELSDKWPELLVLSARSEKSLERRKGDLTEFLRNNRNLSKKDVAFTLALGRNHMPLRSYAVALNLTDVTDNNGPFTDGIVTGNISKIAFMFPGQGAQYVNMGLNLYQNIANFREILDECFGIYENETGEDLKSILFNNTPSSDSDARLASTDIAQPSLFIVEYALAKTLELFGIKPNYLIGHSIGEYVAACLSGVFDLKTALRIVIKRGQLMRKMPGGKMLAVRSEINRLAEISNELFEIAAHNASESCTISFEAKDEERVKAILSESSISCVPLNTSHAFHSKAFEPILADFRNYINTFNLKKPEIPFISCLTGNFISEEEAITGAYWAKQLRNTVRFREGLSKIAGIEDSIFLEVGPNTHLGSIARQSKEINNKKLIISTLGKSDSKDERIKVIEAVGNMFNLGFTINFTKLQQGNSFRKIGLPTYPFERNSYWIAFEQSQTSLQGKSAPDETTIFDIKPDQDEINILKHCENIEEEVEKTSIRIEKVWTTLMGRDNIGLDDDFFEIGGQSLLALQLLNGLREEFGHKVSVKEFLDNSTIRKLSVLVHEKINAG